MKNLLILLSVLSIMVSPLIYGDHAPTTVVRAAIDIGSGATKLRVAEVDLKTQKIVKILESQNYTVPYQEQLANDKDGNFNRVVMDQGIEALQQAKTIAQKYQAEKVIAVATAAFRKAKNVDNYIVEIKKQTGIEVNVIDQHLEGELAFKAVVSQYGIDPSKLIVWDIGGGSFQLTTVNSQGKYDIYRGHDASVPFKNHVIEKVKNQNPQIVSTPNPHTTEELLKAQLHAVRLTKNIDNLFKEKIQQPSTQIVGVGNILGMQVPKMINDDTATLDQMIGAVANLVDKSDADVGGGDFANVYVTNSILVLGFMEGLNMQKIQLADINPADGAFFYDPFWKSTAFQPISTPQYTKQSQPQTKETFKYGACTRS